MVNGIQAVMVPLTVSGPLDVVIFAKEALNRGNERSLVNKEVINRMGSNL